MTTATLIEIFIPGPLRAYANGASAIDVAASTVRGAFEELERTNAALYRNICDETGVVRRHIGVFVNNTHIRDLSGLDTSLEAGDVLTILPAVSGG